MIRKLDEKVDVHFDSALPILVALAQSHFGEAIIDSCVFIRDANGRLTLVLRGDHDTTIRESFDNDAKIQLGPYVDDPSATPSELFDPSLNNDDEVLYERIVIKGIDQEIRLVDRRIYGQDWNRPDFSAAAPGTPIVTFFSCKGGVGRSTALAVAAAALSDLGKSVLIIDLDLEAPGIGPILLPQDVMPDFGALDYLVEKGISGVDRSFLERCVGPSPLTAGKGLVEVVPAVGRIGRENPINILPKLGRVFLDEPDGAGGVISFRDQTRALIKELSERRHYDAIFVDARAGLSDSAAVSLLGLGGDMLMFGVNTPQTFESYEYLLAHLGRFATQAALTDDWRSRIRMVQAKAQRQTDSWVHFRERTYEMFSARLYEEASAEDFDAFNFDIDDPDAPHYAWPIPYDADYAEFDPVARKEQLARDFFDRSFGPFVDSLIQTIFPRETIDGG